MSPTIPVRKPGNDLLQVSVVSSVAWKLFIELGQEKTGS
jgi:hypothetical protein